MPEHISGLQREVVSVQTAVCLRLDGDTLISFALFHALALRCHNFNASKIRKRLLLL